MYYWTKVKSKCLSKLKILDYHFTDFYVVNDRSVICSMDTLVDSSLNLIDDCVIFGMVYDDEVYVKDYYCGKICVDFVVGWIVDRVIVDDIVNYHIVY